MEDKECAKKITQGEFNVRIDALRAQATAGTLTQAQLIEAAHDQPTIEGDITPSSVGTAWYFLYKHHPSEEDYDLYFDPALGLHLRRLKVRWVRYPNVALGTTLGFSADDLFAALLGEWSFVSRALESGEFLSLVSESRRDELVYEALVQHPYHGSTCHVIETALARGISRDTLALALRANFDGMSVGSGHQSNPIADFLSHGGRFGRNRDNEWRSDELSERDVWGIFDTSDFKDLLSDICVPRTPRAVIVHRGKIAKILGRETADRLVLDAAKQLDTLEGLRSQDLETLSRQDLKELVRRVKTCNRSGRTLAWLIWKVVKEEGNFLTDAKELLRAIGAVQATIAAVRVFGSPLPEQIYRFMDSLVEASGHCVGRIKLDSHTPMRGRHAGKRQTQYVVEREETKYVWNNMSHRYYPKEGELVIFNTKDAAPLTPTVKLVHFIPLERDIEEY